MILTRNEILKAMHTGDIVIDPFEEEALDAASYDMTLYPQIRVFIEGLNEIDLVEMAPAERDFFRQVDTSLMRNFGRALVGYPPVEPGELRCPALVVAGTANQPAGVKQ